MLKRNEGFTLVELLVTIVVGTLITAAATTLLLTGMRINNRSNELAIQQNTTRMLMEVMAEIAAEEGNKADEGVDAWSIMDKDKKNVVSCKNKTIYLRETPLLENVEKSEMKVEPDHKQLVTVSITVDGREYSVSIYCRFLNVNLEGNADIQSYFSDGNHQQVLSYALEAEENPANVREFLTVLASQYGSRGQILNADGTGTGEYFSEWYIGSYEDNPGWDESTPWCACYLSWALDQCDGLWDTPRYANVDTWWTDVVTGKTWTASNPRVGDIVFFDWIVDETRNPQHVGAVLAVEDGWIYTIEGNSGNRVTLCRYEADDPCILGYGQPEWK